MQLTRAADYAVRVMILMVSLPTGTRLPLGTLAAEVDVPESFLSKVLQTLTRAGLLVSRRGTDGGFELAAGTAQITMLDVIQAVDGPIQLNICLRNDGTCERAEKCPAHPVWERAQEAMLAVLSTTVISDLAKPAQCTTDTMLPWQFEHLH
jgi:Rrf2 family protein